MCCRLALSLVGLISAARLASSASHLSFWVPTLVGAAPSVAVAFFFQASNAFMPQKNKKRCLLSSCPFCLLLLWNLHRVTPYSTHPHRPCPHLWACPPLLPPPTDADGVCCRAAQHRAWQPRQPAPAGLPASSRPGPAWRAGRLRAHLVSSCHHQALGPDLTPDMT